MLQRRLIIAIRLLGTPPRLRIVQTIVKGGGAADSEEIAISLSMARYEVEPHLTALHEGGVIVLDDNDLWAISPRVEAASDGEWMSFAARTRDRCELQLRVRPEGDFY